MMGECVCVEGGLVDVFVYVHVCMGGLVDR